MAHLLSHQGNFVNQISMLEELISKARHLCLFLQVSLQFESN